MQVGYANHFYRSAHKFEQICRHRLRRQNVGYSNFSQPQSHLSFCVLLQYLVERELNAWERAGADASSAGMVDAGFENQKELTKMQLDNQKEIAEMQNETQKEIAGIQSATSRQNTKDQVYA